MHIKIFEQLREVKKSYAKRLCDAKNATNMTPHAQ
jgi:hypothetical protein